MSDLNGCLQIISTKMDEVVIVLVDDDGMVFSFDRDSTSISHRNICYIRHSWLVRIYCPSQYRHSEV